MGWSDEYIKLDVFDFMYEDVRQNEFTQEEL